MLSKLVGEAEPGQGWRSLHSMELYVIARHAESTLNFENRINGDPAVPVELTEKGRDEARLLGQQLRHIAIDLCIHTRFARTRDTAAIALEGRDVPFELEPLLDDVDVGELEGRTLEARSEAACSTAWCTSAPGTSTVSRTLLSANSSTCLAIKPLDQRSPRLGLALGADALQAGW